MSSNPHNVTLKCISQLPQLNCINENGNKMEISKGEEVSLAISLVIKNRLIKKKW